MATKKENGKKAAKKRSNGVEFKDIGAGRVQVLITDGGQTVALLGKVYVEPEEAEEVKE